MVKVNGTGTTGSSNSSVRGLGINPMSSSAMRGSRSRRPFC
jgi:hypothetical protein